MSESCIKSVGLDYITGQPDDLCYIHEKLIVSVSSGLVEIFTNDLSEWKSFTLRQLYKETRGIMFNKILYIPRRITFELNNAIIVSKYLFCLYSKEHKTAYFLTIDEDKIEYNILCQINFGLHTKMNKITPLNEDGYPVLSLKEECLDIELIQHNLFAIRNENVNLISIHWSKHRCNNGIDMVDDIKNIKIVNTKFKLNTLTNRSSLNQFKFNKHYNILLVGVGHVVNVLQLKNENIEPLKRINLTEKSINLSSSDLDWKRGNNITNNRHKYHEVCIVKTPIDSSFIVGIIGTITGIICIYYRANVPLHKTSSNAPRECLKTRNGRLGNSNTMSMTDSLSFVNVGAPIVDMGISDRRVICLTKDNILHILTQHHNCVKVNLHANFIGFKVSPKISTFISFISGDYGICMPIKFDKIIKYFKQDIHSNITNILTDMRGVVTSNSAWMSSVCFTSKIYHSQQNLLATISNNSLLTIYDCQSYLERISFIDLPNSTIGVSPTSFAISSLDDSSDRFLVAYTIGHNTLYILEVIPSVNKLYELFTIPLSKYTESTSTLINICIGEAIYPFCQNLPTGCDKKWNGALNLHCEKPSFLEGTGVSFKGHYFYYYKVFIQIEGKFYTSYKNINLQDKSHCPYCQVSFYSRINDRIGEVKGESQIFNSITNWKFEQLPITSKTKGDNNNIYKLFTMNDKLIVEINRHKHIVYDYIQNEKLNETMPIIHNLFNSIETGDWSISLEDKNEIFLQGFYYRHLFIKIVYIDGEVALYSQDRTTKEEEPILICPLFSLNNVNDLNKYTFIFHKVDESLNFLIRLFIFHNHQLMSFEISGISHVNQSNNIENTMVNSSSPLNIFVGDFKVDPINPSIVSSREFKSIPVGPESRLVPISKVTVCPTDPQSKELLCGGKQNSSSPSINWSNESVCSSGSIKSETASVFYNEVSIINNDQNIKDSCVNYNIINLEDRQDRSPETSAIIDWKSSPKTYHPFFVWEGKESDKNEENHVKQQQEQEQNHITNSSPPNSTPIPLGNRLKNPMRANNSSAEFLNCIQPSKDIINHDNDKVLCEQITTSPEQLLSVNQSNVKSAKYMERVYSPKSQKKLRIEGFCEDHLIPIHNNDYHIYSEKIGHVYPRAIGKENQCNRKQNIRQDKSLNVSQVKPKQFTSIRGSKSDRQKILKGMAHETYIDPLGFHIDLLVRGKFGKIYRDHDAHAIDVLAYVTDETDRKFGPRYSNSTMYVSAKQRIQVPKRFNLNSNEIVKTVHFDDTRNQQYTQISIIIPTRIANTHSASGRDIL